jgi:Protein of unknown function (DUF2857)
VNDHHAEYTLQTLLYVSRLAAQDDYQSASAMGLRPDQIRTIGSMSLQNLQDLSLTVKTRFFSATFSPDNLDAALHILQHKSAERETILRMIEAGASFSMMNALFGLSKTDHAGYRKLVGLSKQGRPSKPSEQESVTLWHHWIRHDQLGIRERLLAVHNQTGIELSALWALIQSWEAAVPETGNQTT